MKVRVADEYVELADLASGDCFEAEDSNYYMRCGLNADRETPTNSRYAVNLHNGFVYAFPDDMQVIPVHTILTVCRGGGYHE
jgi:hypothetical protein